MDADDPTPLEQLTLLRIACAAQGRESLARTRAALEPYLESWLGPRARTEILDDVLTGLVSSERLTRAASGASTVTPAGRRAALEAFGLEALPARRAWVVVRDTDCIAKALGLAPPRGLDRERLRTADGLRAALLRRAYDLPLPPVPTATQAVKALAWKRLERLLDRSLDPRVAGRCGTGPVIEVLASDWLGDGRRRPLGRTLALAAAETTRARSAGAAHLRRAVLTHWIRSREVPTAARPLAAPPSGERGRLHALEAFVRGVRQVTQHLGEGRFGTDCLLIAAVYDAWREAHPDVDLGDFKARLAEASQEGLLHLQRADLVEAMDADLVQRSQLEYRGSLFHFVRV